jgi:hypothetical protein
MPQKLQDCNNLIKLQFSPPWRPDKPSLNILDARWSKAHAGQPVRLLISASSPELVIACAAGFLG